MNGSIVVFGLPMPQGSKTPVARGKKIVLLDGRNKGARQRFKVWREEVAQQARAWVRRSGGPEPIDGAVRMRIQFMVPRPKSTPKKVVHAIRRPDLDKLCRAVCDSLTEIIYTDDARIIEFYLSKVYAPTTPGAFIQWEAA